MTVEIPADIRAAIEAARSKGAQRKRKLTDQQIREMQAIKAEDPKISNAVLGKVYQVSALTVASYLKVELD